MEAEDSILLVHKSSKSIPALELSLNNEEPNFLDKLQHENINKSQQYWNEELESNSLLQ